MNETEWILKVQEEVKQRLGTTYDVDLGNLRNTAGFYMQGLILRKKGAPDSLTVEVPAWASCSERTVGKAADLIVALIYKERSFNKGMWDPGDFSTIKHRIVQRIISTKENKELLEEVPHFNFLDWSIVSYIYLTDEEENVWTALIRWEHLRFWGITEQQIWTLARENTPTLLPACIRHISEWEDSHPGRKNVETDQEELPRRERFTEESKEVLPLYLLSSEQGIYGASCLLYDNLLRRFCEEKGYNSLLIFPRSAHEVFLLPEEKEFYAAYLKKAVIRGVYRKNWREERLTNSLYRYEREKGRLTIC